MNKKMVIDVVSHTPQFIYDAATKTVKTADGFSAEIKCGYGDIIEKNNALAQAHICDMIFSPVPVANLREPGILLVNYRSVSYLFNPLQNITAKVEFGTVSFQNEGLQSVILVDSATKSMIFVGIKNIATLSTVTSREDLVDKADMLIFMHIQGMVVTEIVPNLVNFDIVETAYFHQKYGDDIVISLGKDNYINTDILDSVMTNSESVSYVSGQFVRTPMFKYNGADLQRLNNLHGDIKLFDVSEGTLCQKLLKKLLLLRHDLVVECVFDDNQMIRQEYETGTAENKQLIEEVLATVIASSSPLSPTSSGYSYEELEGTLYLLGESYNGVRNYHDHLLSLEARGKLSMWRCLWNKSSIAIETLEHRINRLRGIIKYDYISTSALNLHLITRLWAGDKYFNDTAILYNLLAVKPKQPFKALYIILTDYIKTKLKGKVFDEVDYPAYEEFGKFLTRDYFEQKNKSVLKFPYNDSRGVIDITVVANMLLQPLEKGYTVQQRCEDIVSLAAAPNTVVASPRNSSSICGNKWYDLTPWSRAPLLLDATADKMLAYQTFSMGISSGKQPKTTTIKAYSEAWVEFTKPYAPSCEIDRSMDSAYAFHTNIYAFALHPIESIWGYDIKKLYTQTDNNRKDWSTIFMKLLKLLGISCGGEGMKTLVIYELWASLLESSDAIETFFTAYKNLLAYVEKSVREGGAMGLVTNLSSLHKLISLNASDSKSPRKYIATHDLNVTDELLLEAYLDAATNTVAAKKILTGVPKRLMEAYGEQKDLSEDAARAKQFMIDNGFSVGILTEAITERIPMIYFLEQQGWDKILPPDEVSYFIAAIDYIKFGYFSLLSNMICSRQLSLVTLKDLHQLKPDDPGVSKMKRFVQWYRELYYLRDTLPELFEVKEELSPDPLNGCYQAMFTPEGYDSGVEDFKYADDFTVFDRFMQIYMATRRFRELLLSDSYQKFKDKYRITDTYAVKIAKLLYCATLYAPCNINFFCQQVETLCRVCLSCANALIPLHMYDSSFGNNISAFFITGALPVPKWTFINVYKRSGTTINISKFAPSDLDFERFEGVWQKLPGFAEAEERYKTAYGKEDTWWLPIESILALIYKTERETSITQSCGPRLLAVFQALRLAFMREEFLYFDAERELKGQALLSMLTSQ